MSQTTHTPGKWVAEKGMPGEPDRWCVIVETTLQGQDGGYIVAVIENGCPGDTLDTEEANARLIASAPQLAEDLARVTAERDRLREELSQYKDSPGSCDQNRHMANAAVSALGFAKRDEVSPSDIAGKIAMLRAACEAAREHGLRTSDGMPFALVQMLTNALKPTT